MTTYNIGREPDPDSARIVIDDPTVSRKHGTLAVSGAGTYILRDLESTSGTFVREKGGWRRISSASVQTDDEVRLGAYVTTVAELLRRASKAPLNPAAVRLERNPETGEIVKKSR